MTHMQQSILIPDFSSPEFLYYLHSAQLDLPALQGLWLTLGHKPQAEKRTESEVYLEVSLCLLYQGWMGQDTSNLFASQILTTHWSKVQGMPLSRFCSLCLDTVKFLFQSVFQSV